MDLLIDTRAVIWFITEDSKLPQKTKLIIENIENKSFVSIASYWEIAIKHSLGRLELNSELKQIFQIIEKTGFELLPIATNRKLFLNKPFRNFYKIPKKTQLSFTPITRKTLLF